MVYVLKINFDNRIRRLLVEKGLGGDAQLPISFASLETRIRELFQLPLSAQLHMTYKDVDRDVVTMANDADLRDALMDQALNPLRISVTQEKISGAKRVELSSHAEREEPNSTEEDVDVLIKRLLQRLTPEAVRKTLQTYEPVIEIMTPSAQMSGMLGNLMNATGPHVEAAAKSRAAAASAAAAACLGLRPISMAVRHFAGRHAGLENTFKVLDDESIAAQGNDTVTDVHMGVICDGCGASPIVGPRWTSNKELDYDLCSTCFEKHGNEMEYTKVGPRLPRTPPPPPPLHFAGGLPFSPTAAPPSALMPCLFCLPAGCQRGSPLLTTFVPKAKLDARLVCQDTIFNETKVAPRAHFVKMWSLRNTGSIPWPAGTTLVRAGGDPDHLGDAPTSLMQIPEEGLAPGKEINASIALVAPMIPGRYFFIWSLASPAGLQFGQTLPAIVLVELQAQPVERSVERLGVSEHDPLIQEKGPDTAPCTTAEPANNNPVDASKYKHQLLEALTTFMNVGDPSFPGRWQEVNDDRSVSAAHAFAPADNHHRCNNTSDQVIPDNPSAQVDSSGPTSCELRPPLNLGQSIAREQECTMAALLSDKCVREADAQAEIAVTTEAGQEAKFVPTDLDVPSADLASPPTAAYDEESPSAACRIASVALAINIDERTGRSARAELPAKENGCTLNAEAGELVSITAEAPALSSVADSPAAAKPPSPVVLGEISEEDPGPAITYPEVARGLTSEPPVQPSIRPLPAIKIPSWGQADLADEGDLSSPRALLGKLEAMGFADAELNAEVLAKNGWELRKTVDDLCAAEDWDASLGELADMGFGDTSMNRRLLFKNNGSLKRVVLDLVHLSRHFRGPYGQAESA